MMKSKLSIILLFIVTHGLCSEAIADPYGSGWYGEVQLAFEQQENPGRSYRDEDRASDTSTNLTLGGGYLTKAGAHAEWIASGYLTYRDHNNFDGLDNLAVSIGLSGTYQPNLAFDGLWYRLSTNLTVLQYRNSEAREGVAFDLDGSINKRLGSSTTAHLGYRYRDFVFYDKTDQEELRDAAFDTASSEIYISIDHELVPTVFLFAEYGFLHGGLTSSVGGLANPLLVTEAETQDDVFDDCGDNPRCTSRFAYRIITDTHHIDLGVAFEVFDVNVDLTASYFDAEGKSGQRYKDTVITLGFVWNF